MTESERRTPKWMRWAPLVRTSPSGKCLFVCLVCGDTTPSPLKDCPQEDEELSHTDPRIRQRFGARPKTCREIESAINDQIKEHLDEKLQLDWAEDQLRGRAHAEHKCPFCHGYGCQSCLGKGTRW